MGQKNILLPDSCLRIPQSHHHTPAVFPVGEFEVSWAADEETQRVPQGGMQEVHWQE